MILILGGLRSLKEDLYYGKLIFLSFILIDIICLFFSNVLAYRVYQETLIARHYIFERHSLVIILMIIIDLVVTLFLNTLCRVLRRRKRLEILEGAKHVITSIVSLSFVLFTMRAGTSFSRAVIVISYCFYFVLFVGTHIIWKSFLQMVWKKGDRQTAILMTTDRFLEEGLKELEDLNIEVKNIYLLKNLGKKEIDGIEVSQRWEQAAAAICWKMLDRVYIYGLDHQMVPEYLVNACTEMGLKFNLVDFNYRIIDVKTIRNEDPKYGTLSFLEGKRDIPFPIRRVYWITETEADLHRGFHAHKLNCQLLYCPYGKIDIILDDGKTRTTVTLDKPGKGLLLMPGLWREMVWQQSGSVLCVLASEYYDADEYIRNYDEFIEYNKKYRDSADPLKAKR